MKWLGTSSWVVGGVALTFTLVGAVSLTSYQNAIRLVESANQVKQTNEILDALTDVSTNLSDAESRRWGYILFNDLDELEQYHAAAQNLDQILERLQIPLADTPIQQERLNQLADRLNRQLQLFHSSIELYSGQQTIIPVGDPLIQETNANLTAIRRIVAELELKEEELLERQVEQVQSDLSTRMVIEPLSAIVTFCILSGVFALLYRQIIKRQQAEELQRKLAQQKELSELKLQLFSMVSHEFRTPLSLILGSAQLLEESLKPQVESPRLKNLYRIQSAAKTMTQLITDILTLARADAGKLVYNPEWVEMQSFCLNLIEDLHLVSESKRSLQFMQKGNCTHAFIDQKLLYSVLSNLISNAFKYSPVDSCVYLTFICRPDAISFEVRDEGIGILPDDQPRLYEPFCRGHNVQEIRGTGLGLAVVKKCVELMSGAIAVESKPGAGTVFIVHIPQHSSYVRPGQAAPVTGLID